MIRSLLSFGKVADHSLVDLSMDNPQFAVVQVRNLLSYDGAKVIEFSGNCTVDSPGLALSSKTVSHDAGKLPVSPGSRGVLG